MRIHSLLLLLAAAVSVSHSQNQDLRESFASPPAETRPGCYWYWINDNISKEGITKDLEAMARVGIGRAYIGHIYNHKGASDTPVGKVKFKSDEWWEALQWAVKEAGRVGVEIGFFNSPGWSQSGGPWISPSQSMRFLDASETVVEGGRMIDLVLPVPEINTYPSSGGSKPEPTGPAFTAKDFQDVRVLAFRQPDAENAAPVVATMKSPIKVVGKPRSIDLASTSEQVLQSLRLVATDGSYTLTCVISSSDDGKEFRELIRHVEQRGHQGPRVKDPMFIPFPPTKARHFRITLSSTRPISVASLQLEQGARLSHHVRKQLGETSPSVTPPWDSYLWKTQPPPAAGSAVESRTVVDLTGKMEKNGRLLWEAPPGRWLVMRMGMVPIGTQCAPASPEARGLEVDKMSKQHIRGLFDGMVGEFIRRTPAAERKALKYVIADSYETGPQNWTDDMLEKFRTRFGYAATPFLPCLNGRVVDGPEITNRFLWDWRRLIAESIARDYVGGLREVAHEHGLTLWLENYGHWGFPSEFLLYGSLSDQIGGEFWESGGTEGNVELRAASGAANIYGRTDVYAETFTSNRTFQQSPASMKAWTDWAFSAGINHFILHVYIHQPDERKPGILQWFGTDFNRHTTWFEQSKAFMDYLRRNSVLLKYGRPFADVAYYIGENTPVMTGPMSPALPNGYDFDFINSDALMHRAKVVDGRIEMENGPCYAVLVLAPESVMTPEMAATLQRLIREGATVLGPKPVASPSLQGFPDSDAKTRSIADEVWGPVDGKAVTHRDYGKGMIHDGVTLEEVFSSLELEPDVLVQDHPSLVAATAHGKGIGIRDKGGIVFKHRRSAERDIYFLSNTTNQDATFTASFRTSGRQPSLWNPVSGNISKASAFTQAGGRTLVPLQLAATESVYVVFEGVLADDVRGSSPANTLARETLVSLNGPWTVAFGGQGAPKEIVFDSLIDWSKHPDESIRDYSGTAVYETKFSLAGKPANGQRVFLELGEAAIMATVMVNGHEAGTLWCPPWSIDIRGFLRDGPNTLRVKVVNTWHNRLVADSRKADKDRFSHISQPYRIKPDTQAAPSGLLGPVRVVVEK